MKSFIWAIVVTFMIILFLPLGCSINFIQAICYIFVRPFSKNTFNRINIKLMDIFNLFTMPLISGLKVQLHTDMETFELLGKEHAVMMSNHRHFFDFFVLSILAQYFSSCGRTFLVAKDSTKFIPILGWLGLFSGTIFLKRDWTQDERHLELHAQSKKDFPEKFWLYFFVEGTRLTSEKLLAAQQYVASKGLPIPRNVLVPRVKGFVSVVKYMRSFVPAIYDVTIAKPNGQPTVSFLSLSMGKPLVVKVHIKRFSVEELPVSDEGVAKWCRDRFVAKDKLLDNFMVEGTFKEQQHSIHFRNLHLAAICWICTFLLYYMVCHKFSSWEGIKIVASGVIPFMTMLYLTMSYMR
ncbi:hypothetical protein LguiB_032345 [Lonicera macranthoides]